MDSHCVLRRGAWTSEEDKLLCSCIEKYGEGKWHLVPQRSGLNRCRKSCRLRWLNYLSPSINRGKFEEDEVDLMRRMHKLLGNRWSLIAGRLPGRTANDVKNFWNTHLSQRKTRRDLTASNDESKTKILRPRPWTFKKPWSYSAPSQSLNEPGIHRCVTGIETASMSAMEDGISSVKVRDSEIPVSEVIGDSPSVPTLKDGTSCRWDDLAFDEGIWNFFVEDGLII